MIVSVNQKNGKKAIKMKHKFKCSVGPNQERFNYDVTDTLKQVTRLSSLEFSGNNPGKLFVLRNCGNRVSPVTFD